MQLNNIQRNCDQIPFLLRYKERVPSYYTLFKQNNKEHRHLRTHENTVQTQNHKLLSSKEKIFSRYIIDGMFTLLAYNELLNMWANKKMIEKRSKRYV
jgi:hypothetical protein